MSKASGWVNYKATRQGLIVSSKRRRDTRPIPQRNVTKERLNDFVDNAEGPVTNALFDLDLLGFDDTGRYEAKPDRVKQEAAALVADSKDRSYPKSYLVSSNQEAINRRGGNVTERQAENDINRQYAAKATAILVAAKAGNVDLKESESRRLRQIADRGYLDLVYKTSERGTLERKKKEIRGGGGLSAQQKQDFRRARFERTARHGIEAGYLYGIAS